jgi:uncharacterized protein YecE (DUF72 family)
MFQPAPRWKWAPARAGGVAPSMGAIVGTAGWSIGANAAAFGEGESALARYATRFGGVEINSSFHRPHRPATWARWAASVPACFRFAVKLPRTITHERKLAGCTDLVARFLEEASGLGPKLALLLVQLPPKLAFDAGLAEDFLTDLAGRSAARPLCEPRHPSWFDATADALLRRLGVARVAADPAIVPAAAMPGGWRGLAYWRLHGSPIMYRSPYGEDRLDAYGSLIRAELEADREAWCMFDNTASSAAVGDALALAARL